MGRQITSGQMADIMEEPKFYKRKEISLPEYITEKVKMLRNHFKIKSVTEATFYGCSSEIAVDNRARSIILNRI